MTTTTTLASHLTTALPHVLSEDITCGGVYVRAVMGVFQGTPFLHPLFLPGGDSAAVLSGDSEARSSGMEEPRGWQFRRLLEPKVQWIRRLAS